MRRFTWFCSLLLVLFTTYSTSCSKAGCKEGVCINIEVEGPVDALKPATFVMSVKTEKDINNLVIILDTDQAITILDIIKQPDFAKLIYQDQREIGWSIDSKSGEEYIITGHIVLAKPTVSYGIFHYGLIAAAVLPSTNRVTDSFTVYLNAEGKQVEESQAKMELETVFPLPTPR